MKNGAIHNLLEMRPVRVRKYELNNKKGDGTVTILVPKFGNSKILGVFKKLSKHPEYRIHLDEFGTLVWNFCDGTKQVREIGDILKQKFGEKVEPVYDRLSIFLRHMAKTKFIVFRETAKKNVTATNMSSHR